MSIHLPSPLIGGHSSSLALGAFLDSLHAMAHLGLHAAYTCHRQTTMNGIKPNYQYVCMSLQVAWLMNIRGNDVDYNPVAVSYALVRREGPAALYVDTIKITPSVAEHLKVGDGARDEQSVLPLSCSLSPICPRVHFAGLKNV
jgi:hypothetical protein